MGKTVSSIKKKSKHISKRWALKCRRNCGNQRTLTRMVLFHGKSLRDQKDHHPMETVMRKRMKKKKRMMRRTRRTRMKKKKKILRQLENFNSQWHAIITFKTSDHSAVNADLYVF